jgi:hypothetical protein
MEPMRVEGARGILVSIGLGQPAARAFVAGTAVGLVAYALKMPSMAFDDDGEMRPLKGLSNAPTATYTHFLGVPLTAAILVSIFT